MFEFSSLLDDNGHRGLNKVSSQGQAMIEPVLTQTVPGYGIVTVKNGVATASDGRIVPYEEATNGTPISIQGKATYYLDEAKTQGVVATYEIDLKAQTLSRTFVDPNTDQKITHVLDDKGKIQAAYRVSEDFDKNFKTIKILEQLD